MKLLNWLFPQSRNTKRIAQLEQQVALLTDAMNSQSVINNNVIQALESVNTTTANLHKSIEHIQKYVSAGPRKVVQFDHTDK